jgi:hypothetical protein
MTDDFGLDVLPGELIAWARSARGDKTPEIIVNAAKEYRVQTDYDRQAFEIGEDEDLSLVSITGTLTIPWGCYRPAWPGTARTRST